MEIYPGADKTSIMMVLNHKPGALYKVLARIYLADGLLMGVDLLDVGKLGALVHQQVVIHLQPEGADDGEA